MKPKQDLESLGAMLSLKQVAERLNLSIWTVNDLVLQGKMASLKIGTALGKKGGRRLVPESEVAAWVLRNLGSR